MADLNSGKAIDVIDLEPHHHKMVNAVLARYVPFKDVWAYGSRVKWNATERSDLDLVVFDATEDEIFETREAFANSDIPFEVQVLGWDQLPEDFQHNVLAGYYVLRTKEDWGENTLSKIVKFGNGKSRPKNSGDIPVYGGNGIMGFADQANYEEETIIVGRVGAYCGATYFENRPIWVSDNALSAKSNDNNITLYIYYLLKNLNLNQHAQGSSHPLVTQTLLNAIETVYPNIPEQTAIAEVLSSLDDKIDLLHCQNKTLEQLAETLFRQWFVEGAGDDWETAVLPDEFNFTMGLSPPGSSYNEDKKGLPMFQGNADFTFRFPNNRVYTTNPKRLAQRFDTLVSVRAPVGEQNMAFKQCCIGRGLVAFKYKRNVSYYTYTYFKLKSLMDKIKQFNDTGTVFGSISKKDIQSFSITIPPNNLVDKFETEVKPLNDKVIINCNQINTLENLRDTLLPKLMSGDMRVRYDEVNT